MKVTLDQLDAGEAAWVTAAAKDPANVAATERQRQRAPLRAWQRARLRQCPSGSPTEAELGSCG